jgi:hypothetical protein
MSDLPGYEAWGGFLVEGCPHEEKAAKLGEQAAVVMCGEWPSFGGYRFDPEEAYRWARAAAHFGRMVLKD